MEMTGVMREDTAEANGTDSISWKTWYASFNKLTNLKCTFAAGKLQNAHVLGFRDIKLNADAI